MTALTQTSKAQFKFSTGLELGYALEDDLGLMYGASIGGEYLMGEKTSFTAQIGYMSVSVDKPAFIDKLSFSLLPIQAGYKYYFDSNESGLYVHGQIGVHLARSSVEFTNETFVGFDPLTFEILTEEVKISESDSELELSYAIGGGYLINENFDLGLRYNIVSGSGANFKYLAMRAAYNF